MPFARGVSKRRGTTTMKLLDAEVFAKTREPTEADARAFYEADRERMAGSNFEAIKGVEAAVEAALKR